MEHIRIPKPDWSTSDTAAGFRKLGITMLVDAQSNIDRATALYQQFAEYYDKFRESLEWMYAMKEIPKNAESGRTASAYRIPFNIACEATGRDPDAMRAKMLENVPELLQKMIFHGKGYTCRFCNHKKTKI